MTAEHEFTVLQWNVLADWLCDAKAFPHAHNEDCLKWDNRATAFKQILAAGPLPDLVSMQEVDHWDDFFKVEMEKLGLKGHFYKKEAADILCLRSRKSLARYLFFLLDLILTCGRWKCFMLET